MKHQKTADKAGPVMRTVESLSLFRALALDYLEGESETMPSADGLPEVDKKRARSWLESIKDARRFAATEYGREYLRKLGVQP